MAKRDSARTDTLSSRYRIAAGVSRMGSTGAGSSGSSSLGEQRVRPGRPQLVRRREAAVEMLEVAETRERGRLVDDRVGPCLRNRFADGSRVEQVEHDPLRTEVA